MAGLRDILIQVEGLLGFDSENRVNFHKEGLDGFGQSLAFFTSF
jgi:hypothetical protein